MPRVYTRAQKDRKNQLRKERMAAGLGPPSRTNYRRGNLQRYGLTPESFAAMSADQGDVCLICKAHEPTLVVDHCHTTGKVRGLLCGHCNRGLGFFRDNAEALRTAATYIEGELSSDG